MMNEAMSFTLSDENGNETKYETLFTFDSPETGKRYIAYTDNSVGEDGAVSVYASVYHDSPEGAQLMSIETEKEWRIIEAILQELAAGA